MDLPPVSLNHLYLVLPEKTYRAIITSDFLHSAFSGKEQRTTHTAAGETWSGTYYYTRENYLELFGSSYAGHWLSWAKEGWAGLAFSTDQPGGVHAARRVMQDHFSYEPFYELRKLMLPNRTLVNWFHYLRLTEKVGLDSFDAWIMEYHPDIFAHKGIALPGSGQLSREAYLSPWNNNRPPRGIFQHLPLFNRITGATLRMDRDYAQRFAEVLGLFGYAQSEESGQMVLTAHGTRLVFLPEEPDGPRYRLCSLTLEMQRRSVAPATFVFGFGSRLVLGEDKTATWYFGA